MESDLSLIRIPISTYRLHFNRQFTFSDATRIVSYLDELGISDIYASPCLAARKGTALGYDVVDPTRLNPEIGTLGSFRKLTRELRKARMGLILDIVPNHMYVESAENEWWQDVLENGPSSPYSAFFDIDWSPVERKLENKVLIPILGAQYGTVLERQDLKVAFGKGAFFLRYFHHKLPILPETYPDILRLRIDSLEGSLPSGDLPHLTELQSIITGLDRLPSYTESDLTRLGERSREKEIIKKRLSDLCRESSGIRAFVNGNIAILNGAADDPHSFDRLDDLLDKQAWRLSYWRVATEEINYRRFFDINALAAIRVENPVVFEKTHRFVLTLIREGGVTGLRVDHPDGLYNPVDYFRRLQRECFLQATLARQGRTKKRKGPASEGEADQESTILGRYADIVASNPQFKPFYVVGEKILSRGEKLPEDWPIFGTIGYVFLNPVNGIFVDAPHGRAFEKIYGRFTGSRVKYQDLVYEKKRLIMLAAMSGEINMLAHRLSRLAEKNRHTRDFTLNSLKAAITEVIACFSVYRTYITRSDVNDRDRRYIEQAVARAKRKNPSLSESIFDFVKSVLLLDYPEDLEETDRADWADFAMRLQQVSGPVTAKGLEDTAFYLYNRLVSLNEIGGNPEGFGTALDAFHAQNEETARSRPYAMITTSTHDTKRSEDVRARLNVLSELPGEWHRCLSRWSRMNRRKKPEACGRPVPDRNEEYLFYQTLLGVWPTHQAIDAEREELKKRLRDYMVKAVREGKVNSSWTNPDAAYEEALTGFVDTILSRSVADPFLNDFKVFQKKIAYFGMFNSLSQTLLKMTSPGVPDFYQGSELWDFSLVDPDNRRPVDFALRKRMLGSLRKRAARSGLGRARLAKALLKQWQDGAIKLYVTFASLNYRREHVALFRDGEYVPLAVAGPLRENVCAFMRLKEAEAAVVLVPRFLTRLIGTTSDVPLGKRLWRDTEVEVPGAIGASAYRNIFTDSPVSVSERKGRRVLSVGEVFARFPVALLGSMD